MAATRQCTGVTFGSQLHDKPQYARRCRMSPTFSPHMGFPKPVVPSGGCQTKSQIRIRRLAHTILSDSGSAHASPLHWESIVHAGLLAIEPTVRAQCIRRD